MATLPIYDRAGSQVGTYEISPADLAPRINRQLLHDAVVMYRANQRMGTVRTKTRGEVAGSTKKMYRQKGTGNARAGSRRSGIRRGGGHIHALRNRDYSYRLPRRALQAATRMAVAAKLRDNELVVVDQLTLDKPQTKEFANILKSLKVDAVRTLVAIPAHDPNVHLSARNMPRVAVSPVSDLNALAVLTPGRVVFTKAALDQFRSAGVRAGQAGNAQDGGR